HRARWYRPHWGSFVSIDKAAPPIHGWRETQALNRYVYGDQDPADNVDPNGQFSLPEVALTEALSDLITEHYDTYSSFVALDKAQRAVIAANVGVEILYGALVPRE